MPIDRSVDNQHLMTILMYTYSAYVYYCIEHEYVAFYYLWILFNRSKFLNVVSFENTTIQNKKLQWN